VFAVGWFAASDYFASDWFASSDCLAAPDYPDSNLVADDRAHNARGRVLSRKHPACRLRVLLVAEVFVLVPAVDFVLVAPESSVGVDLSYFHCSPMLLLLQSMPILHALLVS